MSPAIRSGDIVSVGEVLREGLPCMGRTGQRPRYLKTEYGVEVHLHADAIRNGTGFATYRYQFDAPVELKGVPFELRGKSYRIGGLFHRTNLDGLVTCVAFYSEETAS